jgi:hypothetical protein
MSATPKELAFFVVAAFFCATRPATALDPRYPDWPCQQLKVPEISVANVWTGAPIDLIDKQQFADSKETDLVTRLAARRTPMDEARTLIDGFVAAANTEKQARATELFANCFRFSTRSATK